MADTSSSARNAALSTAAVIAAATGIYLATTDAPKETAQKPPFSIQEYLPEIPAVTLELPAIPSPALPKDLLPSSGIPSLDAPIAKAPETDAPAVDAPVAEAPKTDAPEIDAPETASPDTSSPDAGTRQYVADLLKAMEMDAHFQTVFRDQRSIEYDAGRYDSPHIAEWLAIYRMYASTTPARIPLAKSARVISEVRMPRTGGGFRILAENLAYYKTRGYDTALLTFYGTESPDELKDLARRIRESGLAIWFAYSGPERLQHSIFIAPSRLAALIRALAPLSDAMLLGWRRTSAHLFIMDPPYMAYIASCARRANPSLPIIGELYYGNTAEYPHEGQTGFGVNCPEWASAVMQFNYGYLNTEPLSALEIARKKCPGLPVVEAIHGHHPYYLSLKPNHLSQQRNQQIKEYIEKRFTGAGALATITQHDDGRDGVGGEPINNNLAETPFAELK